MQTQLEITKSLEYADLKGLANAESPCITIYLPLEPSPNTTQMEWRRLKSAIRRAEQDVREMGVEEAVSRELTESLRALEGERGSWGGAGGSLIVLRSPDVFRAAEIKAPVDEKACAGSAFHLLPIFGALQARDQVFYILALSQKNVRLIRCTAASSEEVELPNGTPTNIQQWLSAPLPGSAPSHGLTEERGSFTSTSDRDNTDEHLANFYRVINKAVVERLRGENAPLVLCGIDSEMSRYKSVNSYQHLLDEGVHGSSEGLKGGEMHSRAIVAAQEFFGAPARKALAQWENTAGGDRALRNFPDIIKAAFEARIAHLFVAEGASAMGSFDRERMEMVIQGRQEDLINLTAMKSLAFGGDVFVLKPEHVPGGGQMAAITRY